MILTQIKIALSISISTVFLMSVLVLGVLSYPSALPYLDQNITAFDFQQQLGNVAFADDDDDEDDDEENGDEEDNGDENGNDENGNDENGNEEDNGDENGDDENGDEEQELEGVIISVNPDGSFTIETEDGTFTIFTDADTEFDDFGSLSDLIPGFGVEVEVVLSNSSLVATEIEIEDELEVVLSNGTPVTPEIEIEDELEEEEELEGVIISVNPDGSFTIETEDGTFTIFTDGDTEFDDFGSLSDLIPGFGVEVEVVLSNSSLVATEIEIEDEEYEEEEAKYKAEEMIYELQQKIEQLEARIQTLLEKLDSGEYFGIVPQVDPVINSYIISFEGSATSIDDESIVIDADGEIFLENMMTTVDVSKFRVTGGEISIDNTFYDLIFGKARVSSFGTSGEKDSLVLIAEVIDFGDINDDTSTLKLVINSEMSLEDDFGLDPINIEILPQSKIGGQWYLSGSGQLSLLEG